ncbi:MAG: DUF58 domain-containing protein [Planctomycetota bacterium]
MAQVSALDLRARMAVEGLMSGTHRSPTQGVSAEFAQHRQYAVGDDTRFLDWKVAAKTDKLYLKQFFKETNLDLAILVDTSGSMAFKSQGKGSAPWRKFDYAATAAAALAHLAIHQQDRVGLTVFDDQVRQATRLSNNANHWRTVTAALSAAEVVVTEQAMGPDAPNVPGRTDLASLFDQMTAKLVRKSLVVLISDLFDQADVVEQGLAKLRFRGHDVLILHVMDPMELTFPYRSSSEFCGLEGEGRLPVDAVALRKAYLDVVEEHLERVEASARGLRFDYVLLKTDEPMGPALSHFLARRNALIGKR